MMDEDDSFTDLKDTVNRIAGLLFDDKFDSYQMARKYLMTAQSDIDDVLFILEVWYRDIMYVRNNMMDRVVNFNMKETLQEQAKIFKERQLAGSLNEIKKFRENLRANGQYKMALTTFLVNMSEV
ncbi:MAG: hypothetical protein MJ246_06590 [Clostridia bacterium]|nr:hypothetical protein [Clostridia bacterium]